MYCTTFTEITLLQKTHRMYNAIYQTKRAGSNYIRKRNAVFTVLSEDTRNYLYIKLHFACKKLIKPDEPCPHQIIKACIAFSDLRCTHRTADHKKKILSAFLSCILNVYV